MRELDLCNKNTLPALPTALNDPNDVNHYFVNSHRSSVTSEDIFDQQILKFTSQSLPFSGNPFHLKPVDINEVKKAVYKIKSNAAALDGVTAKCLSSRYLSS